MKKKIAGILVCMLLIFAMFLPSSSGLFNHKKVIKIAMICQHWDFIDQSFFSRLTNHMQKSETITKQKQNNEQ